MMFSSEEFLLLTNKLKCFHGIFYQLWLMGKPSYSNEYPTAWVSFDEIGHFLTFNVNPNFWKTLNLTQKAFFISHESLHIILNHGLRCKKITNEANIAMDLVVNHMLVNKFGFKREECDPKNELCWIDTIFTDSTNILENQSFEYYISKMEDDSINYMNLADEHSFITNEFSKLNDSTEILREVGEKLTDEEKKTFMNKVESSVDEAGKLMGGMEFFVPKEKIKIKRKWETVIKKWSSKYLKHSEENIEQWARTNRRFVFMENDFFIPSEMEIEEEKKNNHKIQVWFFQDTSGSCAGYHTRFFKAAESLPKDRFDVKMHCFDTKVYETTLISRKLYGFGGTAFDIIENYIQNYICKHKTEYPKAVFVITDGYGNNVLPMKPKNWYWFLTNNQKSCIPAECNTYLLKDYE